MLDPKLIFNSNVTYQVGQKASFTKTIEASDVYQFAGISGDFNPAHLDEVHGSRSMFKTRIAHGMITAGLISGAITMKIPGAGSIIKKQTVNFKKPVLFGDTVTVNLEILELNKTSARISTTCVNQANDIVVVGEVLVDLPQQI